MECRFSLSANKKGGWLAALNLPISSVTHRKITFSAQPFSCQSWSRQRPRYWLTFVWPRPRWLPSAAIQGISGTPRPSPEAPPFCHPVVSVRAIWIRSNYLIERNDGVVHLPGVGANGSGIEVILGRGRGIRLGRKSVSLHRIIDFARLGIGFR